MQKIQRITNFVHHNFLLILLATYLLSALLPGPGLFLRDLSFGKIVAGGETINVTPSLLMLAFLLLNAGLGVRVQEMKNIATKPWLVGSGFLTNAFLPILLVYFVSVVLSGWHNHDETQNLLTGLALIVAMPIAGSSTAWSQNANGNLSLSLGLVILSTVLSPFITPICLNACSGVTSGDYAEDLQELAQSGTNLFMCLTVVLPSLAGIVLHFVLGERKVASMKPVLKLLNFAALLTLNYSNAATSLPQTFRNPDWDFVALIGVATTTVCVIAFGSGWLLSKIFKTDECDKAALMFGLGMNNNGTGLVLATTALKDHPAVFLPMIFYTLAQQITAAIVDKKMFSQSDENETTPDAVPALGAPAARRH